MTPENETDERTEDPETENDWLAEQVRLIEIEDGFAA